MYAEKLASRWYASCGSTQTSIDEIIPFHFGMFRHDINAYVLYAYNMQRKRNCVFFPLCDMRVRLYLSSRLNLVNHKLSEGF